MKKIIEIKESILNTFLEMDDDSAALKIAYYLPSAFLMATGAALGYSGKINVAKLLNLKGTIFNLKLPMLLNVVTGVIGSLIVVACWRKVLYGRKHKIDDVNGQATKKHLDRDRLFAGAWNKVVASEGRAIFLENSDLAFKSEMSAEEAEAHYKDTVQQSGNEEFMKHTNAAFLKGLNDYVTGLSEVGKMEKQAANMFRAVCATHSQNACESFIDYLNRVSNEVFQFKFEYTKEDFETLRDVERAIKIALELEAPQPQL